MTKRPQDIDSDKQGLGPELLLLTCAPSPRQRGINSTGEESVSATSTLHQIQSETLAIGVDVGSTSSRNMCVCVYREVQ